MRETKQMKVQKQSLLNSIKLLGLLSASLVSINTSAFSLEGLNPMEQGLAIANEIDKRENGFGDFTASMNMQLFNRNGDMVSRRISVSTLETDGDGDKSLSVFEDPADVKGTKSLTFSHGLKPDDQWLYLPALKRVKRISSKNKSGPFMGSEFAFEDIGSQEVNKYTYKLLKEESINGEDAYVVERTPAYKHSGYTRQISWIDKSEFRVQKVEFYDRKNALLKTLIYKDYKQYLGKYWRASLMEMSNQQTKKRTNLVWSNYKFKTGIKARDFNKNSLAK